jgi:hypothetical protein
MTHLLMTDLSNDTASARPRVLMRAFDDFSCKNPRRGFAAG